MVAGKAILSVSTLAIVLVATKLRVLDSAKLVQKQNQTELKVAKTKAAVL
jgi:hypothetical protein